MLPIQAEGDSYDWSIDEGTGEQRRDDQDDKDKTDQAKLELMAYSVWTASHGEGWPLTAKARGRPTLSTHHLNRYRQQKLKQYRQLYTDVDFEFFHAVADAEKLMQVSARDLRAELPWSRNDAMIVLETPFQSRCFYYDIREDRCFSVLRTRC